MVRHSTVRVVASKLCMPRPAPQREGAVVTVAPHSGGSESRRSSRAAERRKGMNALTGVVAESLSCARTPRYLRERFEDELCALLNARRVDLRDGVAAARPAPGCLSLPVRRVRLRSAPSTSRWRRRGAGRVGSADAWERAAPGDARVDHRSRHTRRPSRRPAQPTGWCGAADWFQPGIRAVRERIERVAATDFTVLIEGESGSERSSSRARFTT